MLSNPVQEKLRANQLVLSMIVRLAKGAEIASIAKTAGLDTIYVDLEHGSFSLESTSQICMSCLALGVAPFVRLPGLDPALIGRILDGGALGIIAPHVEDAETAAAVVRAAKYPPFGARSYSSSLPHFQFRAVDAGKAMKAIDDATTVIAMIESANAVERADEIAAVPGIDILHVGVNDLSNSLGAAGRLDHPLVREAFKAIWAACQRNGRHLGVGGLASKPDFARELIAMGARYLTTGSDLGFLLNGASERVRSFRA